MQKALDNRFKEFTPVTEVTALRRELSEKSGKKEVKAILGKLEFISENAN